MTIDELMARIQAAFPWRSAADLERAAEDYRAVLGQYAGPKLASAWQGTIGAWRDRRRPLPGDIAANVVRPLAGLHDAGGAPKGDAIGPILDDAMRRKPGLIEAWWRDNDEWVGEQIAARGFGEADAWFFRRHLGMLVDEAAWRAAQWQARGRTAYVDITGDDVQNAVDRVRSQPAHGNGMAMPKPGAASRRRPAPIERTMDERLGSIGLEI